MKAVVYHEYGNPNVFKLAEVTEPTPKENEVRIKIHATTVTAAEGLMRRGEPVWGRIIIGLRKPRKNILGIELAGEIDAIGKNVTRFQVGDQVYGFTGFGLGAYAEYTCMPEDGSLAIKPANMTYEEAATSVDGATTSLFFLKEKGKIQAGQKVLINGASGSIGTFAVQLAHYFGAEVTGVCSARNVELVYSLGADNVIDYTQEDFTKGDEQYDIIFDTVGKSSFARCKNVLRKNGCYLPTVGLINHPLMMWTSLWGGKRVITGMSIEKRESLNFLRTLIEVGQLKTIIDRSYPLEQMAEAHQYVDSGHKRGNVVITL